MKTTAEIAMEKDTGYVPHGLTREELIAYCFAAQRSDTVLSVADDLIQKFGKWEYGESGEPSEWVWHELDDISDADLELLYWRLQ